MKLTPPAQDSSDDALPAASARGRPASAGALRILMVDDNARFLAAVRQFLDRLPGAEIVGEAHDGGEALAMTEQLQPDLVLLDIVMPAMNGMEVAHRLQAQPSPVAFVFLSSHDGEAYRSVARALGALGFVNKSDFVAELLPIIEQLCAHKREGRP